MTDGEADSFRKSLVPQPRRKGDARMLIENLRITIDEFEASLPPDIPEDEDVPQEPDSADLKAYKRKANKLRRELRGLREKVPKKVPQKR